MNDYFINKEAAYLKWHQINKLLVMLGFKPYEVMEALEELASLKKADASQPVGGFDRAKTWVCGSCGSTLYIERDCDYCGTNPPGNSLYHSVAKEAN